MFAAYNACMYLHVYVHMYLLYCMHFIEKLAVQWGKKKLLAEQIKRIQIETQQIEITK